MSEYASFGRALGIFQVLARERHGLPLSDLAIRMGLAKSVTHRLLNALVRDGYVQQDEASQRYALTLRLPALGFRYLGTTRLSDVCQPILDRLAHDVGELVQLGIVDGDSLTWMAWAQGSTAALRYAPVLMRDVVLTATASGAAWLAELPEAEALAIIRTRGFAEYGARPVRSERQFLSKLRATKARGYGTNLEEGEPGINAVAVAFRADLALATPVAGTLTIAGPATRLAEKQFQACLPRLRAAAVEISEIWPMHHHLQKSGGAYVQHMQSYKSNYGRKPKVA